MKPGERIKEFRESRGLTQEDFAKTLDFSQGYISEIERSVKEPTVELLKALNENYQVSSDYVLYGWEPRSTGGSILVSDVPFKYEMERRNPINASRRRLIRRVLRILDSGNRKVIRALVSNLEVFTKAVERVETEPVGMKEDM